MARLWTLFWSLLGILLIATSMALPARAADETQARRDDEGPVSGSQEITKEDKRTSATPLPTPYPKGPSSRELRAGAQSFMLANYSLLDLLVLGKYGATAGIVSSSSLTWEIEYLRGNYVAHAIIEDLGNMVDTRVSLIARSYLGNSFNVSYGLTYFDFYVGLGEQFLTNVNPALRPAADHLEVESLGLNLGFGNRWQLSRKITLGVDWLTWSQPLILLRKRTGFLDYVTTGFERGPIEKAIGTMSYFPRFTVLKLQLGILF